MKILPEPIAFEWDEGNIDKNLKKHDVTDREAEEVFTNDPKFVLEDQGHAAIERRYMLWGSTSRGRKLTLIFTIRGDKIRVISTRDMSRKERKSYEQRTKTNSKI